ncbi:hypothetical protein [Actinacidiphila guanduensis]|jgi:hypothetical protein|uniref:Uncharacterized protein n=1 Tax=Actinacidiphila guanduensis TaxID=310781 RepID=A0A1G9ZM14_9ACTN|nr:hypothetical protein [Actinacidiphila guanduensis]SDN22368.1 hypothetical protein SAMN05216259_103220 [Actinacidiphila guanduensis]
MDLTAAEVDCELLDLSGVSLADLGSLDATALDLATDLLLDTSRRPTMATAQDSGGCPATPEAGPGE